MVKLKTERLVLLTSATVEPELVARFYADNRSFFEPWSSKVADEFYTVPFWQRKLDGNVELQSAGLQYTFYVFMKEDVSQVVAQVSLSQIVRGPFQSCFMGYMTAEKHCRKGIMHEAITEVVNFAFEELNLHRIEANIIPRNEASVKLVEKLGFEYEGLSPKYLQINGVWEDHKHYVIRNKAME